MFLNRMRYNAIYYFFNLNYYSYGCDDNCNIYNAILLITFFITHLRERVSPIHGITFLWHQQSTFEREIKLCRLCWVQVNYICLIQFVVQWNLKCDRIEDRQAGGQIPNRQIKRRADVRLAPSQWKTSLQSNTIIHWLGANPESALERSVCVCVRGRGRWLQRAERVDVWQRERRDRRMDGEVEGHGERKYRQSDIVWLWRCFRSTNYFSWHGVLLHCKLFKLSLRI